MATIQVTTYSLKPGVSSQHFIAADEALQEWTYLHVEGIARRTTARNSSGKWITIRLFADASQTSTNWFDSQDAVVVSWRELVDETSIDSCDYDLL